MFELSTGMGLTTIYYGLANKNNKIKRKEITKVKKMDRKQKHDGLAWIKRLKEEILMKDEGLKKERRKRWPHLTERLKEKTTSNKQLRHLQQLQQL